ncbi:DUF2513 domain-containing protein [Dickeya zeae]|uniref:DUF2513 domain-containing protein n=1 Tax=Dickeya zeae TaxID=204042 RepID=UPI001CF32A67|nr:DUF2513 domain-containing protein [Dickeya zeae]MCA6987330.1 DUF2513 domain-containing protein [Dickeya zeae]
MRIDHDYLKGLLEAFENADGPQTNIQELAEKGFSYGTAAFLFHMRLLDDKGLICQSDGRAGFGVVESADGFVSWSVLPLRLTAAGHDFIDALRNREVWATLKESFKDASMGTLMTVSKELFNRALNKQLNKYFD